jgi:hypothetical protein
MLNLAAVPGLEVKQHMRWTASHVVKLVMTTCILMHHLMGADKESPMCCLLVCWPIGQLQDPRIERIACTHSGTYADDCLCERVRQHKCYIVATCDKDLRRRIRKVSQQCCVGMVQPFQVSLCRCRSVQRCVYGSVHKAVLCAKLFLDDELSRYTHCCGKHVWCWSVLSMVLTCLVRVVANICGPCFLWSLVGVMLVAMIITILREVGWPRCLQL